MKSKSLVILAVLAIALVSLVGVASAKVVGTAQVVGAPIATTTTPGVMQDITGYVYNEYLINGALVTADKVVKNDDGTVTVKATGLTYTVVGGGVTLTGPGAIGTSILFENGKPVATLTGDVNKPTSGSYDSAFYKTVSAALGLNEKQVQAPTGAPNLFESWMR